MVSFGGAKTSLIASLAIGQLLALRKIGHMFELLIEALTSLVPERFANLSEAQQVIPDAWRVRQRRGHLDPSFGPRLKCKNVVLGREPLRSRGNRHLGGRGAAGH
jgi:hypothetical protein